MAAQLVPLSLLMVEDNLEDAELVLHELRRSGFTPQARRVQNQQDYLSALAAGYAPGQPWDVILSDYALPNFSGPRALQLLREFGPDVPFIVVSGTIGEDVAVAAIKDGASDYLLKDRLTRLGPAVKRALEEQRLRQSHKQAEDNYYQLFENSLAGLYQTSPDGRLVTANSALARLLGYDTPAELIASLKDLARQSYVDPGRRTEFVSRMAEADVIGGFESELYRQDGSTIWVSESARAVRDEHGTLLYYEGIIEDITARKLAGEALRLSEERYRLVSELASDFAYAVRVEPDGTLAPEWVTEAFTRVTGFTLAEVDLAGGWPNILHPDDIPAFDRRMRSLLAGRSDVSEYRTLTKSGRIRWLRDSGRPVWDDAGQRVIRLYGSAQDITERKQAEDDVAQSEQRFRALIDNSSDGIALINPDGTVLYTSSAAARIVGGRPDDWIGGNFLNRVHPEEAPRVASLLAEIVQTPGSRLTAEFRFRRNDGSWFWLEATAANMLAEPAVNAIVVNYRDITERKHADEALAQERNMLRTLIDNLPDAVYVKDVHSRFVIKNLADARRMGAATPDETIGKSDFDFYPPDLAAQYFADDQSVIESGQPIINREEPITDATGRIGWISTTKVPLRDRLGNVVGLVGIGHDITEGKRAEEEIKYRLAELEAVNQVSKALRTAQTLDEMLPVWLDVTLAVMQASGGSIWLYDPSKEELRPAVTRGWAGAGPVLPQKLDEGVNGYVFVTGQPYISSNFRVDLHAAESNSDRIPPGGGAAIPIRVEDQVIGTFVAHVPLGREITRNEVHLLTTLAEIAGTAIQRTRLFQQTKQRLSQLSALRAIDHAITASMDLHLTLTVFLDHAVAQLGVDAADVLLLDQNDQTLSFAAGHGFRTSQFQRVRVRVGEGRAGRAVQERRMVVAELNDVHPVAKRTGLLTPEDFVSYFGVPLIAKGLVLGALEVFHRSPLNPNPEWLEFLSALAEQAAIALDNAALFNNLQRSNTDLQLAYDATIEGWARALDLRDRETEGHSRRVTMLTEKLAVVMGVPESQLVQVRRGALLHDIGKMGVPDYILLKPGPLSDDEWTIMRQHPVYAYEMLSPIEYLRPALDIPYGHHEKWDGSGYPRGLSAEQIPLAVRMFTVVDVWDALRSDRPYRRAWPADQVRAYLLEQAGKHFDPAVLAAFLAMDPSNLK